jgi:hypothetical protein
MLLAVKPSLFWLFNLPYLVGNIQGLFIHKLGGGLAIVNALVAPPGGFFDTSRFLC